MERLLRAVWMKRLALFAVADVVLAVIIWTVFDDPDGGLDGLLITIVVIWVVGLVWTVKVALWNWLGHIFLDLTNVTDGVLISLRSSGLPAPKNVNLGATFDYLSHLIDIDDLTADERVKAACLFTMWSTIIQRAGAIKGAQVRKALDEAVLRFNSESPNS